MPGSEFAEATLPTQHLVTLALHAVFLESRFNMRDAGALSPKGSVGRGQDRPRGGPTTDARSTCPGIPGARSTILSSLAAMPDGQGAMENWFLGQNATGQTETPEEMARQLSEVTPERIRAAAETIELDTVYFLKGKEGEQ